MMRQRTGGTKHEVSARQSEGAQALAVQALSFLAADPERMGRFLSLTGLGPGDLRAASRETHFLAGVLEHIASDQRLLMEFADHVQIKPGAIDRARMALGAGDWERDTA